MSNVDRYDGYKRGVGISYEEHLFLGEVCAASATYLEQFDPPLKGQQAKALLQNAFMAGAVWHRQIGSKEKKNAETNEV